MPDFSLFKPFFTSLEVEILAPVFLQGCKDLNFISPTCFFNLVSPPQFAFLSELSLLMSYCTKVVIFQKHYLIHFELFSSCNFRKQKIQNKSQAANCLLNITMHYNIKMSFYVQLEMQIYLQIKFCLADCSSTLYSLAFYIPVYFIYLFLFSTAFETVKRMDSTKYVVHFIGNNLCVGGEFVGPLLGSSS